ncbi:hypothetical protein BH09MYX1_BH09MYX1_14830 [soil metagenome]
MDPYAPIQGISLERYAELSALVSDVYQDAAKAEALVAAQGVSRSDWEAAKAGWTARMQDPSLMGQVATQYMALYNAALARKNPVATMPSWDDYVAMSGCAKAWGLPRALEHYRFDMNRWTQIATHWNGQMAANMPAYASWGPRVEQEGARIAAGGAPRPLGSAAAPAPGYPAQQSFDRQAEAAANEVGKAAVLGFNALGSAFSSFGNAVAGFAVGARVLVTWSDGNRYPATVAAVGQNQYLVNMSDGKQHWIPSQFVATG